MANRRGPSSLWGLVGLIGAVAGLNVFPQARDGSSRPAPLLGPRQQDAMCGVNSPGGSVKCGMNVCCSGAGWCGTTEAHCSIPNGCQQGFGHCGALRTPLSCDPAAKSTNQRSVGYYQAVAAYDRPSCGAVTPSQINTAGYTHLYFSFVSMDPATFAVKEFDARDVPLLSQFTALKSRGVQTWVAVGGFRFSDADQPTHQTWSNMVATQANRARFISSLTAFMAQYGFQGADIDWEWPVDPARGGRPGDTAGLVALVREMRAAFGTRYGISIAVPPDYPALRYFDLQAMEPSLDFIGFMSYDLRTASDPSGVVKSHTNLSDIAELAKPLWFAGLNPFKINLGLASYARGFTVRSPGSCPRADRLGCPFSGPNKGGPCTASPGVMSLNEVNRLISEKGLRPVTLGDATVKVVTYDGDQWLGYDDAETWAAKKSWANSLCIGGTMVWSLDFHNDPGTPGPNPSPSTALDHGGRCGAAVNGGTVCGAWPDGNCCSSSGWCGRSAAHCGEGCVSGDCQAASGGGGNSGGPPVSKDGRCGRDFGGTVCTGWPDGECCSAAGWCGKTSAHCGSGCQSRCS